MLRLLNAMGLPNVVAFSLSDPVGDTEASIFNISRQERDFRKERSTLRNLEANRYLQRQFKRLRKYAESGNKAAFDFLARKLLTSYAFQLQAYNSVFPKWVTIKHSSVVHQLRYLRKLCWSRSTDLDYKRVWIDKKPGDLATRPLGVPTIVWRVYLRMLTNLGEIYVLGIKGYSNFQHGGRPGKGVVTALIDMIKLMQRSETVFEYDLKGFFDHIRKDVVSSFFSGTFLEKLFENLLNAKPRSYSLPDVSKDEAVKIYESKVDETRNQPGWRDHRDHWYSIWSYAARRRMDRGYYDELIEEAYKDKADPSRTAHLPDYSWFPTDLNLDARPEFQPGGIFDRSVTPAKARLSGSYKEIMETGTLNVTSKLSDLMVIDMEPTFTEQERAEGRDSWKDLNLEHSGIPQGTSFGPFLASTVGAYYLRGIDKHLMYMDDGMVFDPPQGIESLLQSKLDKIGVSLAPEKCRLRKVSDLLGTKFLGTRTFVRGYASKAVEMFSETRFKGTSKPLADFTPDQMLGILEKLYAAGHIKWSKYKFLKWLFISDKSRLKGLLSTHQLHVAIKYGFFGYLLSMAYSPTTSIEEMKELIAKGMREAQSDAMKNVNSMGHFILAQSTVSYMSAGDETSNFEPYESIVVPDLYNLSTLAIDLLLQVGCRKMLQRDIVKAHRHNKRVMESQDFRATYAVKHRTFKT